MTAITSKSSNMIRNVRKASVESTSIRCLRTAPARFGAEQTSFSTALPRLRKHSLTIISMSRIHVAYRRPSTRSARTRRACYGCPLGRDYSGWIPSRVRPSTFTDPGDPSSLGDNAIKSTGGDRAGRFWVGTSQTLDEFDRNTGKVERHVLTGESGIGLWFHQDRFGVFWIVYGPDGSIATFDPKTNKLTRYRFDFGGRQRQQNEHA